MRILIAEKDANGRRLLEQIMRMEGYEVFIAECGKRAKKLIRKIRPDIILMNVFYPQPSSGEPLEQIKILCNKGPDPVICVTCMGKCDEYNFKAEAGESGDAMFDRLPSNLKIRIVDRIQRLCVALERFKRWSSKEKGLSLEKTFSLIELESLDSLASVSEQTV